MNMECNLSISEVIASLEQSFKDCSTVEADDNQVKASDSSSSTFFILSCGHIIRIMYSSASEAARAKEGFRKFLVSDAYVEKKPQGVWATFKHWSADFNSILPKEYVAHGARMFGNKSGRLRVVMGFLISCVDYEHQVYYFCTSKEKPFIGAHAMVNPFFLWGMENKLILTHSACVGYDGKGVLLVADGGGGKSTLAVSCLMKGMDFVSDDYTMLSGEGNLIGMPIYSNIGLTPESFEMLQPPYLVHWIHEANRNKKFMNIAGEDNFCDSLEIKALVTPTITEGNTVIYEVEAQPVLMNFFKSSMKQVLGIGNQEYILKFMDRLRHLKAYRIELGSDVNYNAEYLRDFLQGGL